MTKRFIGFILRFVPRTLLQRLTSFMPFILTILYKGDKVECTVCEHTFRKFMPYGRLEPRDNALCPHCLSLERHRLIWIYLKRHADLFTAPLRLLHVAPEICFMHRLENLANLDYISADLESPLAKVKMDIHAIPFEENHVDVIFCNHVLEHVEDDLKVLKEFYRVLKPGGWAILQSPIDYTRSSTYEDKSITSPRDREKHFGQDDHMRVFGQDYPTRLASAGFVVEEHQPAEHYTSDELKRFGLDPKEILYVCKK